MRVLHCATLISPDGAYGGPVRVACGQVAGLRARGHEALLIASSRGFGRQAPEQFDGAPVRLLRAWNPLPALGFAATTAPSMLPWLLRRRREFDVVHIHLARDLVTLPVAALCLALRIPYVLQCHGMIDPSDRLLARILDAVAVRRVLRGASALLVLREIEREQLETVARTQLPIHAMVNGMPLPPQAPPLPQQPSRVLFLARLQQRKRPLAFIEAARALHPEHPHVDFRLVGPDEGEGPAVRAAIAEQPLDGRLHWDGPVAAEQAQAAMAQCDIYVLPSHDEPFPMSVLEAMSLGRPVIISHDCGLAERVRRAGAGIVVGDQGPALEDALRRLLDDARLRRSCGEAGRELVRTELSLEAVIDHLEPFYRAAEGRAPATTGSFS